MTQPDYRRRAKRRARALSQEDERLREFLEFDMSEEAAARQLNAGAHYDDVLDAMPKDHGHVRRPRTRSRG